MMNTFDFPLKDAEQALINHMYATLSRQVSPSPLPTDTDSQKGGGGSILVNSIFPDEE